MKKQRKKSPLPELPVSLWWLFPVVSLSGATSVLVWGAPAAAFPGLEPFFRPSGALLTGLTLGMLVLLLFETFVWQRWRAKMHAPGELDWPTKAFESCQNQVGGSTSTTTVDLRIAVVSQTRSEIEDAGAARLRWYATFALGPLFGAGFAFLREVQTVGQAESFSVLMYPGAVAIIACFVGICWVNGLWWLCRTATIEWETYAREEWDLKQGTVMAETPAPPATVAAPQATTGFAYAANGFQGPPPPMAPPPAPAPQPAPAPAPFNPFGGPAPSPAAASALPPNDEVALTDDDLLAPDAASPTVFDPLLGATPVATKYDAAPPAAAPWQDSNAPMPAETSGVSSGSSDNGGANRETAPVDVWDL